MTLIVLPQTPQPTMLDWQLEQPAQLNVSEWTGKRQVLASGRGWWTCTFTLPFVQGVEKFAPWRSFIAAMQGQANVCRIPVGPISQYPDGGSSPALVNGASQTGRSLIIDGLPVSETVLVAGQFITVDDQLLTLTANLVSDVNGQATASFEPALRQSPADDAVVDYREPYALMSLTEPVGYNHAPDEIFTMGAFVLREAF